MDAGAILIMRRVVLGIVALLMVCLGCFAPAEAGVASWTPTAASDYDGELRPALATLTVADRGPPSSYDRTHHT